MRTTTKGAPIIEGLQISPDHFSLATGQQQQLVATLLYSGGVEVDVTADVTWASDSGSLSIDPSGLATAGSGGLANVTATLGTVVARALAQVTGTGGLLNNWYYVIDSRYA